MSEACVVRFLPSGEKVRVPPGTDLARASALAGIPLELPCGGRGRCGACRVVVVAGDVPPTPTERERISPEDLARGVRFGCGLRVFGDLEILLPTAPGAPIEKPASEPASRGSGRPAIVRRTIDVPRATLADQVTDLEQVEARSGLSLRATPEALRALAEIRSAPAISLIVETGGRDGAIADGELVTAIAPGSASRHAAVAFDIGTTTVSASLVDIESGEILATEGALNRQARFGADVISRITRTIEEPEALAGLRDAVAGTLADLAGRLAAAAGVPVRHIVAGSLAGNPAMTHLALGVSPRGLGLSPYVGVFRGPVSVKASALGLPICATANVFVFPSIASHVGGDMVADLLASRALEGSGPRAVIDLGTNAEIVAGDRARALACSTAAGPAFEGATIRMGMRAADGAIHRVDLDGEDIRIAVIGGGEARGICGTGLIDAVASLLDAGVIDETGRLLPADDLEGVAAPLRARVERTRDGLAVRLSGGSSPVRLHAVDVRQLQLVKGSIAAGLETLLDALGVAPDDLIEILLAGAFGSFVRPASARRIGLVPPRIPVRAIGNAACAGARLAAVDAEARDEAARLSRFVGYVELASRPEYPQRLAEAMAFPERGRTDGET
ncbi:MAG: DUF4445 domain-containing protein [Planctomycetes bacterium]|nr:DUF4445 domain-containing protein [Planctomycetota bacterium]